MLQWFPIGAVVNLAGPATNGTITVTDTARYIRQMAATAGGSMTFYAIGVARDA